MVKLNQKLAQKSTDKGYPDLVASLKGMKQEDIQKVLEFLINEVAELTERVDSLVGKDDKITKTL